MSIKALEIAPRVLSLLDRQEFSPTYGCFDKDYWHFKTKDFPSAAVQMGAEYLSQLWAFDHPDNKYYRHPEILQFAKASFVYALRLQHKDGSFDEWYPQERGWAGPTSYVMISLCEAYAHVKPHLSDAEKNEFAEVCQRAADFLIQRDEKEVLANHYVLYLLSLLKIHSLFSEDRWIQTYEKHLSHFFANYVSEEGWALEYDGLDFGYSLATLSFFARMDQWRPDPRVKDFCQKSFQFLQHFVLPDGSLGGGLGSRSTVHLYPKAFVYWGAQFPQVQRLWEKILAGPFVHQTGPEIQDDHYLFYRACEYFMELEPVRSLSKTESHFQFFQESGLWSQKTENFHLIIAAHRGAGLVAQTESGKNYVHQGWVLKRKNQFYTSVVWEKSPFLQGSDSEIQIHAVAHRWKPKYFNVPKMLLFRLVTSVVAFTAWTAYWWKYLVRQLLITGKSPSALTYERTVSSSNEGCRVQEKIVGVQKGDLIYWGGPLQTRHVPQSQYFSLSTWHPSTPAHVVEKSGEIVFTETFSWSTGEIKRCVE